MAPTNEREAAIITRLAPGAYTAILRGQGNTTGLGLVEIYNLDAAGSTTRRWSISLPAEPSRAATLS
ncbi:MAG: hypothetical protein ABI787_00330 [Spartobacteria bacterium]